MTETPGIRRVSRAELITFFYERDPEHYSDEVTQGWAERCADEFIRQFFGVEPLPEPEYPQIIDLNELVIDPGECAGFFVEARLTKPATPLVITRVLGAAEASATAEGDEKPDTAVVEATASAPAADGVYVTDQFRDPEAAEGLGEQREVES